MVCLPSEGAVEPRAEEEARSFMLLAFLCGGGPTHPLKGKLACGDSSSSRPGAERELSAC